MSSNFLRLQVVFPVLNAQCLLNRSAGTQIEAVQIHYGKSSTLALCRSVQPFSLNSAHQNRQTVHVTLSGIRPCRRRIFRNISAYYSVQRLVVKHKHGFGRATIDNRAVHNLIFRLINFSKKEYFFTRNIMENKWKNQFGQSMY